MDDSTPDEPIPPAAPEVADPNSTDTDPITAAPARPQTEQTASTAADAGTAIGEPEPLQTLDPVPPQPVVAGITALNLPEHSGHQGRRSTFTLLSQCSDASVARIQGRDEPLLDVDTDPVTFTIETAGLDLGTHVITFECDDGLITAARLFVYRQNGAERGGANSVVMVTGVGVASSAALLGLPLMAPMAVGFRRRDQGTGWSPFG